MRDLKHIEETSSYMQLCLYQEDKGNIYLMVPTVYDSEKKQWLGFVKTPNNKLITGKGSDSKQLEVSFNSELRKFFEKYPNEALLMFKPLEYWESRLK